MVEEQRCRMQGRGIRSESQQSQQSRSPDSACSLGYDSRESSPDRVPDGEVLHQETQTVACMKTKDEPLKSVTLGAPSGSTRQDVVAEPHFHTVFCL